MVASSFGGAALWLLLGVAVVVVVGAVAVTATLLYLVRSISLSVRELGKLREVLAQQQVTQRSPADVEAVASPASAPTEGQQPPAGSEAKDDERGGPTEG